MSLAHTVLACVAFTTAHTSHTHTLSCRYDGVCASAAFRLGCPLWWGGDGMCEGAAAGLPAVPLFDGRSIVEQPINMSTLTSRMDARAVEFILRHGRTQKHTDAALAHAVDGAQAAEQRLGPSKPHTRAPQADPTAPHHKSKDDDESEGSNHPFFLLYAMTHMHAPQAFAKYLEGSGSNPEPYYHALRELDDSVGHVMAALRDGGLLESTVVVFTSDNGPWNIKCDWKETGEWCIVQRVGCVWLNSTWRLPVPVCL